MANEVKFKYTADGKQFNVAISDSLKKTQNLQFSVDHLGKSAGKMVNEMGKVAEKAKTGFEKTTKSATKNTVEEKGILGWFKRLSIAIRAMHLHGIDPATNKFARFFSVIGGAGITAVTLLVTGLMLVYKTVKSMLPIMIEGTEKVIARVQLLSDEVKKRIENLKKEKDVLQQTVQELIKLNDK